MRLIIVIVLLMLVGCKGAEPITDMQRDTLIHYVTRVDSIKEKDSIYVSLIKQGDTVYLERNVYRWRDRIKTDTIYKTDIKTEYKTIVREVEKEKHVGWWKVAVVMAMGIGIMLILRK